MADGNSSTQIVTIEKANALSVFTTDGAIDPLLARIRQEIDAFTPDLSTDKGRKAIASIAYKVAQSKTYLDGIGKELVAEQKKIPNLIDATRKRLRDTLDAWKDEVRRPLTEWEAEQERRANDIAARVSELQFYADDQATRSSEHLRNDLGIVREIAITEEAFGEKIGLASALKDRAVSALEQRIAAAEQAERDALDLARLRQEEAERHRIAREAQAKEEMERRAAELAAEQVRKAEADAAAKVAAAEAAAAREKQAAERKAVAEKAAEERRQADLAHRGTVHRMALLGLTSNGIDEATGRAIIKLIVAGSVPHVTINY